MDGPNIGRRRAPTNLRGELAGRCRVARLIVVVIAIVMLPGVLGMGGHGPQLHQLP